MSGEAQFDPEETRAEPLRIREQAQGFLRIAGQLTGRQDSLTFVLGSLAASFSEVLHPLISARIGEQFYTLQDLVGAMLYAKEVTDGWAADVATFQQQRAVLMQRWESACSNGFWITRVAGYDNVEPEMLETLYDDAQHRVLTELNAEASAAYGALSVAAQDRGRQLRQGPTVPNLLDLIGTGLAGGPGTALLYPFLPVPGPVSGLPREYWGMTAEQLVRATESDPALAALLVSRRPDPTSPDPFEAALARAVLLADGDIPGGSPYGGASAARVDEVAQVLAGIPPDELALLAALFPSVVGNLNGMPFDNRIAANRIRVADALAQAGEERAGVLAEIEEAQPARYIHPSLRYRVDYLDARIEQYDLLLTEPTIDFGNPAGPPWPDYRGRKLLYFDPSGDGAWAELVGSVNAGTDAVGILVPGVGTDIPDMYNKSNQATEFVAQAAREGEQLSMIIWAGGDLPDAVPVALFERSAASLSQPLVDFSNAVRHEIDAQTSAGVPVTVIGHSYGGLTVAMATLDGLAADRLLLVNSPGLGSGLLSNLVIDQLENYESYAMAAPWDITPSFGPLVHGAAPSQVDALTQLETGTYRDGTEIRGLAGHSGVFQESSTAWENILAVLLGRPVQLN